MSFSAIPEIDVQELARKLQSDEPFVLLDVREVWELDRAKITDSRLQVAAMSRLAQLGIGALSDEVQKKETEILILCHHGVRSAQATQWLRAQGWTNAFSVRGGIDEYARLVDASVGKY